MNVLLPATTCMLALAFAAVLAARFASARQPQYAAWSLGLLWYGLAAGCEALGAASGWNPTLYRVWYATGAIGVAGYLGAGSIYLHKESGFGSLTVVCLLVASIPALATRHATIGLIGLSAAAILTLILSFKPAWFPHAALGILLVTSAAAALGVANAPVAIEALPHSPDEVVSGQAFDAETRALTPGFNIAGAAVLILGAAASALRYWRTRTMPRRVLSNVLIALGAFIPSLASGLTRFGVTSLFFAGELLGLACIVAGFLLSGASFPNSGRWSSSTASDTPPPAIEARDGRRTS